MKKKKTIGTKIKHRTNILLAAAIMIVSIPLICLYMFSYLKNNMKQLHTIAQQTAAQIDSIHQNIAAFSKWIPLDQNLQNYLSCLCSQELPSVQSENLIINRLTELTGHASGVSDIMLILPEGTFSSIFLNPQEFSYIQNSSWLQSARNCKDTSSFSYINKKTGNFYYYIDLKNISNMTGEMIICADGDTLKNALDPIKNNFRRSIWLDNQNSTLINCDFPSSPSIQKEIMQNLHYNYFSSETLYNSMGIFSVFHTEVAHWKFISYTSYNDFFIQILPLLLTILFTLIIIIFIASHMLSPVIYNLVEPIEYLSKQMKVFPYSKIKPLHINTGDEIEELAYTFNQMAAELQQHIQMLLDEQKKEEQMRYGLMVSQINPHFIYNTMNTINYLARKNRTEDIVIINSALIHILKDCLRINEFSVFDTLQNEIEVTKEYLTIQNFRYPDKIKTIWNVDKTLLQKNIPKQLLQPIIENALIHGFFAADEEDFLFSEPKQILITIIPDSAPESICIRIEDNGIGIDMEKLSSITEYDEETRGKHIGLSNIKWRLSYLLGDRQKLEISPVSPHGTLVVIRLYN